jgi:hypothetical protein
LYRYDLDGAKLAIYDPKVTDEQIAYDMVGRCALTPPDP